MPVAGQGETFYLVRHVLTRACGFQELTGLDSDQSPDSVGVHPQTETRKIADSVPC